ncbi:MAG: hypothetical protein J1F63_02525 [Oscillospiraceae bacterium]|nr:hypothetical protein [Oscillospiraceae bacterium]
MIIFTNVPNDKFAGNSLYKKAKRLRCIMLRDDICSVSLRFHHPAALTRFILINPDETVNVNDSLLLAEKYRDKIKAEIYVFASSAESECLLDAVDKGGGFGAIPPLKIRRVNVIRNQIYKYLFENSIFENAVTVMNEKIISVLIVGLGSYGTEVLKAILWCGQIIGYILKINVVDISPDAEQRFYADCPGIRQRGNQPLNGEDYYELTFYSGVDVFTESFSEIVKSLDETTQVFVCLGNEQSNIEAALKLRSVFSGMSIDAGRKPRHTKEDKQSPEITAVIDNIQKAALLRQNRLRNFKDQYYDISCIGCDSEKYSYENIFIPTLEKIALEAHLKWGGEESFNNFEYYRRSSMASAIHKKYRLELLPDDAELRAMNEHIRWNAYMRSTEGYSFGLIRDDLARRHATLIKYSLLAAAEKNKDSKMNTDARTEELN